MCTRGGNSKIKIRINFNFNYLISIFKSYIHYYKLNFEIKFFFFLNFLSLSLEKFHRRRCNIIGWKIVSLWQNNPVERGIHPECESIVLFLRFLRKLGVVHVAALSTLLPWIKDIALSEELIILHERYWLFVWFIVCCQDYLSTARLYYL